MQETDIRDAGSIPGPGKTPEERHGHPLQHSFLENPMHREAWGPQGHKELDMTEAT